MPMPTGHPGDTLWLPWAPNVCGMTDDLICADLAADLASRALRRIARLRSVHQLALGECQRLRVTGRVDAEAPQHLHRAFEDCVYLAVAAVGEAIEGRRKLVRRGHDLPRIRNEAALLEWRDSLLSSGRCGPAGGPPIPLGKLRRDLKTLRETLQDLSLQARHDRWADEQNVPA